MRVDFCWVDGNLRRSEQREMKHVPRVGEDVHIGQKTWTVHSILWAMENDEGDALPLEQVYLVVYMRQPA